MCFSQAICSQEIGLQLIGKDSIETTILNKLSYQKQHKTIERAKKEVLLIQESLKNLGYFSNELEGLTELESEIIAAFSLGPKISYVTIFVNEDIQKQFPNFAFSNQDSIRLPPQEVQNFMESMIKEFDDKGRSFTEIKLVNQRMDQNQVFVDLYLSASKKRSIDKIVVKGYDDFPQVYIRNYFQLDEKLLFSKKKLQEISSKSKALNFVDEIKPPEVLFKKDSTLLYLFLKRLKTSSVDGILNFASKEDGSGILINGNIDLKLNNVLNTGEQFELYWNRVKEGNSEFKIGTKIPYLFQSNFSFNARFTIYRQDSTFLNTTLNASLGYQLLTNTQISVNYQSENSDYLLENGFAELDSYSSNSYGLGFDYIHLSENPLFDENFRLHISPFYRIRQNSGNETEQITLEFNSTVHLPVNNKSYIYLRNVSGLLFSKDYLTNELYRIGGASSLRGFIEQSIFTDKFSYLNVEYRYLTSSSSYIHTITDIGLYSNRTNNRTESVIGAGFGYLFRINNNQLNLGYAIGIDQNRGLDINNSQLIIKWTSLF